jgi:hypothetical protein
LGKHVKITLIVKVAKIRKVYVVTGEKDIHVADGNVNGYSLLNRHPTLMKVETKHPSTKQSHCGDWVP